MKPTVRICLFFYFIAHNQNGPNTVEKAKTRVRKIEGGDRGGDRKTCKVGKYRGFG